MMVNYIDAHREKFGVEPICKVLQVAPSTYYAARSRLPSARQIRDRLMMLFLLAIWVANFKVYGAHKLWKAARRAGHDIGRGQVARLMKTIGIEGCGGAGGSGPLDPTTRRHGHRIWWSGTSPPLNRTGCGSPISLSYRPGRVSPMCVSSSTPSRG